MSTIQSLRPIIIVLRLTTIIYVLACILMLMGMMMIDKSNEGHTAVMIAGSFTVIIAGGIALFSEIVLKNLRKQKFWAWVCAIIISGFYVPTIFAPMGIVGLWGLLRKTSRSVFLKGD